MRRRFVIGDIHGCVKTLFHLVEKDIQLTKEDQLYFLGDYIDRGPDSKAVFDYLMLLKSQNLSVHFLKGNHEDLLLKAFQSEEDLARFIRNGGDKTIESFNAKTIHEIPTEYIAFVNAMEHYIELDKVFLVHAGFNFKHSNPFEDKHSMLWIRNFEVDESFTKGKTIVHGHTPAPLHKIKENISSRSTAISIDNGCVYKKHADKDMYRLVALNIDTFELIECDNKE